MDILVDALKGAALGLFTVFLSWSKKQNVDKFDLKQLATRVPIGIVVGALAGVLNVPFTDAKEMAAGIGMIYMLDHLGKLLSRRVGKLLQKLKEKKKLK